MAKSLIESIVGKMTDEEGLFQGGEQGQLFGRLRGLLRGGSGVHETLDREIESSPRSSYNGSRPSKSNYRTTIDDIKQQFTEPSRYLDIIEGVYPEAYEDLRGWSEEDARSMSRFGQESHYASKADDVMRAILGNQYGRDWEEEPYTYGKDYYGGGLGDIMKIDWDSSLDIPFDDTPLIPQDITDIVTYLSYIADEKQKDEGDRAYWQNKNK